MVKQNYISIAVIWITFYINILFTSFLFVAQVCCNKVHPTTSLIKLYGSVQNGELPRIASVFPIIIFLCVDCREAIEIGCIKLKLYEMFVFFYSHMFIEYLCYPFIFVTIRISFSVSCFVIQVILYHFEIVFQYLLLQLPYLVYSVCYIRDGKFQEILYWLMLFRIFFK